MPLLFTKELIDSLQRRFATVPEPLRPTIWRHAVDPGHTVLRAWLEDHLASLEVTVRGDFMSRLRSEQRYTQALAELATAHVVLQPGYTVTYGPKIDGLTPDLLVTDPAGYDLIVEVWRRGAPDAAVKRNNAWAQLAAAVQRIPVPVLITLAPAVSAGTRVRAGVNRAGIELPDLNPPDDAERRALVAQLRHWLTSRTTTDSGTLVLNHMRFRIVGTTASGHTELVPVIDGMSARRDDVMNAIETKVKKYRRLADKHGLPLLLVFSADDGTAMNASQVKDILAGQNVFTMTIPMNGVGPIDSGPIRMRQSDAPPVLDAALSGVGWLDIGDGAHAQIELIWQNPAATRPVEPLP